jgi:hypothetical protein
VWYGTSIAQGGVASRPGMAFTNIIQRALNRDVYKFGFSSNGHKDPAVVDLLNAVQPPPAAFVIDCEYNMAYYMIRKMAPVVHGMIRKHFPNTTIVFAQGQRFGSRWVSPPQESAQLQKWDALSSDFAKFRADGDLNSYLVNGSDLLAANPFDPLQLLNPTVGGVHLTDLGACFYFGCIFFYFGCIFFYFGWIFFYFGCIFFYFGCIFFYFGCIFFYFGCIFFYFLFR